MLANYHGNPVTTMIVTYAPCEYAEKKVKNKYYEKLRTTVEQIPAPNFLIILSDMNAIMGPETVPYTCKSSTNNNGSLLRKMME